MRPRSCFYNIKYLPTLQHYIRRSVEYDRVCHYYNKHYIPTVTVQVFLRMLI